MEKPNMEKVEKILICFNFLASWNSKNCKHQIFSIFHLYATFLLYLGNPKTLSYPILETI